MGAQVLTVPKIRQKYNLLNVDVCDAVLLEGEIDNRKNLLNCNIKLLKPSNFCPRVVSQMVRLLMWIPHVHHVTARAKQSKISSTICINISFTRNARMEEKNW